MASQIPDKHRVLTLKKIEGKPGEVWYPLHTQTVATEKPKAGQLLLRPTHMSLNHRDLFLRQHLYPAPSFTTPMLSDACCVVVDPSSSGKPKRVIMTPGHGWISDPLGPEKPYGILGGTGLNPLGVASELIVVDEEETAPCPEHLSSEEAAALPLVGLTAWRAVVTKSGAVDKPGKNILITGIGGGVALLALLFAVAKGAKVWVTSGDQAKIDKAKQLGAQGGVSYKTNGWEKELKGMLPKDRPLLDAVVDGAGGDVCDKGAKLLRHGGVIVSYGMTVGPKIVMPMSCVLKNIEVRGSTMGSRQEFHDMVAFVGQAKIRPPVSKVVSGGFDNMEGIEELFEDMKHGKQFGKLVLAMEGGGNGSKL